MNPIRKYRMAKGYTQIDLAKLVGVTQTTVSHWESGMATPRGKNLITLSEVLEVSTLELLTMNGA